MTATKEAPNPQAVEAARILTTAPPVDEDWLLTVYALMVEEEKGDLIAAAKETVEHLREHPEPPDSPPDDDPENEALSSLTEAAVQSSDLGQFLVEHCGCELEEEKLMEARLHEAAAILWEGYP